MHNRRAGLDQSAGCQLSDPDERRVPGLPGSHQIIGGPEILPH